MRNAYNILVIKCNGQGSLEDADKDESIILKWIFAKEGVGV
jgi:hypothetical protein